MDATPPAAPAEPHGAHLRRGIALLVALWIASLVLVGWAAVRWSAPRLASLDRQNGQLRRQLGQLDALRQQIAVLKSSDATSRAANQELQDSLSERDEEVSALRADVAFYERLVGADGQRRGLTVHSVQLAADANGSWHYTATLTQNLNRGKVTEGDMSLQIDGTRAGKLQTLQWADLLQKPQAPAQAFKFRYFQKIDGVVMLPAGFTPHAVKVVLHSEGNTIQQAFPWADALSGQPEMPGSGKH